MNSRLANVPWETLTVGFEDFFNEMRKPAENKYPPYNILKTGEKSFLIEMAVAGFSEDELDIHLEDGQILVITGKQTGVEEESDYIHKGLSTRNFTRKFTLANDVEVRSANMENGLLTINVKQKDSASVEKIELNKPSKRKSLLTE